MTKGNGMRKLVLAMLAGALLTTLAFNAGAGPQQAQPTRVIGGTALHLNSCNRSPDNAREWQRFARCTTGNDILTQKWAHRLDVCFNLYRMAVRNDDAYQTLDPDTTQSGAGLVPALPGDVATLVVTWRPTTNCN